MTARLPKPAAQSLEAKLATLRERSRSAPAPAPQWQPYVPLVFRQTEAGPGLMRCELHGVYRARIEFGQPAGCRHCRADLSARRSAEEAAAWAAEMRETRMDDIGLAGRYRVATFDSYHPTTDSQKAALEACRGFAEGIDGCAVPWLLGPCGLGKTHLLAAIAHHVEFERAGCARLTTPRAIVRRLRGTWAKGAAETEDDVICDIAHDPDVLLLDEAGLGFGSNAELVQLADVIGERYDNEKPIVLASNLSAPDLRVALGDRIFDRLREGARALVLDGPSYRGQRLP